MTYNCYDIESGRVVSTFANVAGARLTGAVLEIGSAVVTVASTSALWPGMWVVGKGIPANTVVLSVDTDTTFTMTANATAALAVGIVVARGYVSEPVVKSLNIEHYRDIFGATSPMQISNGGVNGGALSTPGFAIVLDEDPTLSSFTGGTFGGVSVSGAAKVTLSDELGHVPPREQVQKVSTVFFICTDGAILPAATFPHLHFSQEVEA